MKRCVLVLLSGLFAFAAEARVISYAPYTDRTTVTAFQHRNTRHFLAIELTNPVWSSASLWEIVLYDSAGHDEPRVVFTSKQRVYWAAMWEDERHLPAILIAHDAVGRTSFIFSNDGGRNFRETGLPQTTESHGVSASYVDNGGPFTRGRFGPVRIGNGDFPFVVYDIEGALWRVAANGVATRWIDVARSSNAVIGADATATRYLVRTPAGQLAIVGFDGTRAERAFPGAAEATYAGWIAPDGRVYLEQSWGVVWHLSAAETTKREINGFAIPTHDYAGAWIVTKSAKGTTLLRHTAANGFEEMFSDPKSPQIEALHAGASGKTLLIQAHRRRPSAERILSDPVLAVWRVGEPAPREYDELFLAEENNKGFVHVDPDRIADGDPFVFDSGIRVSGSGPAMTVPNTPADGLDTLQESGIIRGSLEQQLVLPAAGRALGAFGSNWTTDVTLYNPASVPQKVELRFVQSGSASNVETKTVILNAKEVRLIPDLLGTLFGRVGSGALFLTPERDINATSRTYTRIGRGTYGFGMNAIDVFAGASPRLPVTFAGAFPGPNFRTNVTLTNVTGRGSEVALAANGKGGAIGAQNVVVDLPAAGQQQINGLETQLGIPSIEGGLLLRPRRGFIVPSVFAIDNRTNDPTWFPPDASTTIARWIAVMGHLDGANGAMFRTDLYLYNTSPERRAVYLFARPWDTSEGAVGSLIVELNGNESRVIRDAYRTLFGKTGLARLRYYSSHPDSGVRVTARTYSVDANGGTYGYLTPPVNGFQIAARGEALEILVNGGEGLRANLGIVEMSFAPAHSQPPASARIEIIDPAGRTIDDFTVSVPIAGGRQMNDVFRSRGHGDGPDAALIRVSPMRGSITAFATVTDNTTNDSMYLSPYLKPRE